MNTSYKMKVSSTSGIGLYDFGNIKVSHNAYVNGDEIITNSCIDLDYEIKTIEEEYDCIVTSIGDGFICVTTNFEYNYYKYSEVDIIETSIIIDGEEFKITEKTTYPFDFGIEFSVETKAKFTFKIRVPKWCKDLKEKLEKLVFKANNRGGSDNISIAYLNKEEENDN